MTGWLLSERLGDADLALLARASGRGPDTVARLRADPAGIEELLADPRTFDLLFGARERDRVVGTSAFLAFAVLVARTRSELGERTYVTERLGSKARIPVFDTNDLAGFLEDPYRRFFMSELLTSYTHVASGVVWTKTARGWRRRRYSELDPVRLALLADEVSSAERPLVLRRLGDLALFLTGVFPEEARRRSFGAVDVARLRRAVPGAGEDDTPDDAVALLEWLGRRWYRAAWRFGRPPEAATVRVLGEVAERFGDARRVLNFMTERFLFPMRDRWFGGDVA